MKDRLHRFFIQKFKVLIDYINNKGIPTKYLYAWYYKWVISLLREDFLETQRNVNNVVLRKNHVANKVWVMWWQGLSQAPQLVKRNYQLIRTIFGKENVVLIDKYNYLKYTNIQANLLQKLNDGKITYTLWSDIIRYNLLLNNGGLWIDSTVVVSKKFNSYFQKVKYKDFISLCNNEENDQYVSHGKWTGWFIGGKRDYDLFRFVTCFFEIYFKNHNEQIDYMLVDDAVYYYYTISKSYREIIRKQLQVWDPYLFARNYKSVDSIKIFSLFNTKRKYSVQKFSYKINNEENIPANALYYALTKNQVLK